MSRTRLPLVIGRRQELDDVDGLDALRPGLEGAEHVPDALLRSIYIYRFTKRMSGGLLRRN